MRQVTAWQGIYYRGSDFADTHSHHFPEKLCFKTNYFQTSKYKFHLSAC